MCFIVRINENVNDDEDEYDIEFGNFDGDDDEIDEVSFIFIFFLIELGEYLLCI